MLRATLSEIEIRRAIGLPETGNRVVDGLAPLGAVEDRCLYFINKTITDAIRDSLAVRRDCIVIIPTGSSGMGELGDCTVMEVADPRLAIANVLRFITAQRRQQPWVMERKVDPSAVISPLAVVAERVENGGREASLNRFASWTLM